MATIKPEDINENTTSFWKSLSTLSDKENDSPQITSIGLAQKAILNLQEYSISTKPTCREDQAKEIEDFILEGIRMGGRSQTLYIAGMPGIGKTLTVTSVIDSLRENTQYRKHFRSHYINGMAYRHPTKIYKSLLYKLFKIKGVSSSKAIARLDYLFTTSCESKVRVIVLDELDYLMTKDQSVLYNLFEWSQNPNSKLIFIAIANTMNLPELLKQRTYSRMGDAKIAFRSYTKDQIYQIVVERLKDAQIFDKETLRYACTKLSTFSCDIRKILFILRTALNIFIQKSNSELVQIQHIQLAFNETVRNKPESVYIRTMSKKYQLILIHLALASQNSARVGQCTMSTVGFKIHISHPQISYDTINRATVDLKEAGILQFKDRVNNHTLDTLVRLNVTNADIKGSIDEQEFQMLLQLLQG